MDDAPSSLDLAALATRLGVTARTLRSWVAAGVVPPPDTRTHRFDRSAIVRAHAAAALRRDGVPPARMARFLARKTQAELRELGGLPQAHGPRALTSGASGAPALPSGDERSRTADAADLPARVVEDGALVRDDALAVRPEAPGAAAPLGAEWRRIELLPGLELHVRADASPFVHGLAAAIAAGRVPR